MAPLFVFIALNLFALDRVAVEVSAQDDVRNEVACIGTPLLLDCSDVTDHVILATVTLAMEEEGKSCDVGNRSDVINYRNIVPLPQEVIDQVFGCVLKNEACSLQSTTPITHYSKPMDHWEATYKCVPRSDVYAVRWGNHHVQIGQVVTVHNFLYANYSPLSDNTTDFYLDAWSQIDISVFEWKLPTTAVLTLWSLNQSGGVLQSFRFTDTSVPQTLTMEGFGIRVDCKATGYTYFAFTFNSTALPLPDTTEIPVTTSTSGAGVSMTTWGYGVPVSIPALLAMTIPAIMARKLT